MVLRVKEKYTRIIVLLLAASFLLSATVAYAKPKDDELRLIYDEDDIGGVLAYGQDDDYGAYEGVISVRVRMTDLWIDNPVQSPPVEKLYVTIYKWPSGTIIWEGDLEDDDNTGWVSTNGGIGTTIKVNVDNIYGVYDEDYHYSGEVQMYIN
jgi:hypothetical protein